MPVAAGGIVASFIALCAAVRGTGYAAEVAADIYREAKPVIKAAAYFTVAVLLINWLLLEVKR